MQIEDRTTTVRPPARVIFAWPEEMLVSLAAPLARRIGAATLRLVLPDAVATARVLAEWDDGARRHGPLDALPQRELELAALIQRSGRAQVLDALDAGAACGAPILLEGRVWGAVIASHREPLGAVDLAVRVGDLAELLSQALVATPDRGGASDFAAERRALQNVAELVEDGGPAPDLFDGVTREVGALFGVEVVHLGRYERDAAMTVTSAWSSIEVDSLPAGTRLPLGGENLSTIVRHTGAAARIDDYARASGPIGLALRGMAISSAVAAPIVVDGRIWGIISMLSTGDPLPPDTEARLASFTQLVATAISNAESHVGLERLAEQQAALRRVATLVARDAPSEELFAAVAQEVGQLLPVDIASLARYEADGSVTTLAIWSERNEAHVDVGARWTPVVNERTLVTLIAETGAPARFSLDPPADWLIGGG